MKKESLERKLHQTTSNTNVIEYNKKYPHERERICITDYSPVEYEELVFLQGSDFEKIFGVKDGSPKLKGKMPVVKVTNPNNGKSVHLLYRTSSEIKSYEDYAVMTFSAIKKITSSPEELKHLKSVNISEGNKLCFLINHPIHSVRCSIRLGFLSVILSIISIIIAVFS
jgi:hypothetical protein